MRAAIDVLAAQPAPRVLVIGDMGEVGDEGPAFHREVGAYARERGIDALFALGDASRDACTAYGDTARHFGDVGALVGALLAAGYGAQATLLVKAAVHEDGARGRRADEPTRGGHDARCTLSRRKEACCWRWRNGCKETQAFALVHVPHVPCGDGHHHRARSETVCGPWVIRKLTQMKVGQAVRKDGPQTHLKSGTPTMGGVLILIGIAVATLLWGDLTNRFIWIVMLVTFGFGVIGWVDDYRKVVHKDPRGMSSREKYFWQSVIGLFAAVYLAFSVSEANNVRVFDLFMAWVRSGLSMGLPARADLMLPFLKSISYPLGVWASSC